MKSGAKLILVLLVFILLFTLIIFMTQRSPEDADVLSRLGSRGEEVRKIQTRLKNWGYYSGSVDGIYGAQTRSAVRYFQQKNGLTVDGIAGPKTLAAMGISSASSSGAYSSNDIYLLAKVIAAESRGEPYTGQVAVGAVILNRVEHPSFPDTISGVVYQKGAFTCVTDSNWNVSPNDTAQKAARDAINGWDPSGGAIYYYNPAKTTSSWMFSRPVIVTIGNHRFCK
ncbi:MAG: spore cortex-lytic enzyme [Ruminococcaceae bacterium]|nr:spore cortex-lytic enzyme [Oscillospiraceae bacterium]